MDKKINLISFRPNDDKKYGIDKIVDNLYSVKYPSGINFKRIFLYFARHVLKNSKYEYIYMFSKIINDKDNLLISIGGDLYCGNDTTLLSVINKKISRNNKSVFDCLFPSIKTRIKLKPFH